MYKLKTTTAAACCVVLIRPAMKHKASNGIKSTITKLKLGIARKMYSLQFYQVSDVGRKSACEIEGIQCE